MGKVKVSPKNKVTRFQSFVVEEVGRELLKNAPYNPRRITDDARARLKAKIEKVGLVTPLVWNRRTGNLVGGHQRLSILDELEARQDYRKAIFTGLPFTAFMWKLRAFTGLILSYFRTDVEGLARMLGKKSFR